MRSLARYGYAGDHPGKRAYRFVGGNFSPNGFSTRAT